MSRKKICIITGSRAEWGLFYPLACEIRREKSCFLLQIIAAGAHLSKKYGMTHREIERDGFKINKKVSLPLRTDTEESIARSVSKAIFCFSMALKSLRPDLVFLIGDRFETFSASIACFFLKIPIGHIHGGEITEGSMDDSIRHAITKLAQFHFVSTQAYRKRVIQMGEEPSRVYNTGALCVDNIIHTRLLSKRQFEKKMKFKLGRKNILITFNPSTAEDESSSEEQLTNLLKVLDNFKDVKVIFTKPNPDIYSGIISKRIDEYVSLNRDRCTASISLGRILYLSALQFMDIVGGNSSSGVIEAPLFGIPTVNIGNRQKGRIKSASIIDADNRFKSIEKAFSKAFTKRFKNQCKVTKSVYGNGNAAKKIIGIIKKINNFSIRKKFFDINFELSKVQ